MQRLHHVAEAHVELAVLLQVGGDAPERVVFGHVAPVKVSDHDSLLRVELLQILDILELPDRVFELLLDELGERFDRARPAILPLSRLPVAQHLQGGVFGDVKAGRDG